MLWCSQKNPTFRGGSQKTDTEGRGDYLKRGGQFGKFAD